MRARWRNAGGAALLLLVAATAGAFAWLQMQDLLTAIQEGAPRMEAGAGLVYGFIAALALTLIAAFVVYADVFGRPLPRGGPAVFRWTLIGSAAALALVPALGRAVLAARLHQDGYTACAAGPLHRFVRTEWVKPPLTCDDAGS